MISGRSTVGLDDVHHRLADLDGVVGLGAGEALGAVLVADVGAGQRLLQLPAQPGRVDGDLGDAGLVEAEHDPALQHRGRVVEVDDRPVRALQALVGALDQLGAALRQHLDDHVVGDQVLLDQLADEVEVGLAGRREPDLDLLEAHRRRACEHAQLAGRVHRVDQRLVAVAQVDRAPPRRLVDEASGQVRSVSGASSGENGRYLSKGMGFGVTFSGARGRSFRSCGSRCSGNRKTKNLPARRPGGCGEHLGGLALHKQEERRDVGAAHHRSTVTATATGSQGNGVDHGPTVSAS